MSRYVRIFDMGRLVVRMGLRTTRAGHMEGSETPEKV